MSCPKPCLNGMILDQKGGCLKLASDVCTDCDSAQTISAADFPESVRPSLLCRLLQATLLLDTVMEHAIKPFLETDSKNDTASMQKDISKLALDLHQDRCRGAEVNCSILALCVRYAISHAFSSLSKLRYLPIEQQHLDHVQSRRINDLATRCGAYRSCAEDGL